MTSALSTPSFNRTCETQLQILPRPNSPWRRPTFSTPSFNNSTSPINWTLPATSPRSCLSSLPLQPSSSTMWLHSQGATSKHPNCSFCFIAVLQPMGCWLSSACPWHSTSATQPALLPHPTSNFRKKTGPHPHHRQALQWTPVPPHLLLQMAPQTTKINNLALQSVARSSKFKINLRFLSRISQPSTLVFHHHHSPFQSTQL